MYVLSVNTSKWLEGTNCEIRVEFEDDARLEAEKWSGPAENMIERCFWRLVYLKEAEIRGESVTFRLDRQAVLRLVQELHEGDSRKLN
jgi:hypothetical protein